MMQKGQDERVVTWRSPHRWRVGGAWVLLVRFLSYRNKIAS